MTELGPALICPDCGHTLSSRRLGGLCPRCIIRKTLAQNEERADVCSAPLRTPAKLGEYELLEEIGRGGMGVVYRARQLGLGRQVAVKLMREGALATEHQLERFHVEAETAASLQHPGIAAIYGIGETDGHQYFSMEYVEGRNLAEITRERPLAPRPAAELLAAIAEAVQHAHDRGVLHRDLKPSNVIIDAQGRPHITDFGLAKRLEESATGTAPRPPLTVSGQVLGTPGYMAPEQAAGQHRQTTTASDVYSLGALLYHVLTGSAPFTAETPGSVLRLIEESEPVAPHLKNAEVPLDLETICLHALRKEPHARYPTAREFADELQRWLRNEPILSRPATRLERGWRWCRRNPALALATGAAIVLLLGSSAGSIWAARRIERARRAEAAGRAEAQNRLHQGERVLDYLLGDLYTRLDPVGRIDILEQAVHEVERFYAAIPLDQLGPEAVRHRARAQLLLGRIRNSQGRSEEARAKYQAALALYRQATAAQPTNTLWMDELSQAWNSLAVWEHSNHNTSEAESAYQQATRLTSRLLTLQPDNASWIDSHASILHNLGALYDMVGRLQDAERTYTEALQAWSTLLQRQPDQPEVLEHLAQLHQNFGFVQEKLGRTNQAEASHAEALRLCTQLVQRDPKNMAWLERLADIQQLFAERDLRLGRRAAAKEGMAKARHIREQLAQFDPANAAWQLRLEKSWRQYGQILSTEGNDNGAADAYKRAREVSEKLLAAQAETAEWRAAWQEALEAEEAIHRRLAAQAERENDTAEARQHRQLAAQLQAQRLTPPAGTR